MWSENRDIEQFCLHEWFLVFHVTSYIYFFWIYKHIHALIRIEFPIKTWQQSSSSLPHPLLNPLIVLHLMSTCTHRRNPSACPLTVIQVCCAKKNLPSSWGILVQATLVMWHNQHGLIFNAKMYFLFNMLINWRVCLSSKWHIQFYLLSCCRSRISCWHCKASFLLWSANQWSGSFYVIEPISFSFHYRVRTSSC